MIRPGRPGDLAGLGALQAETLDSAVPALLELGARGAGATLLVSTDGDRPVGYVLAVAGGGPTRGGEDRDAGTATVVELAVAPDARREGRATALLAALADRLAVDELRLTVRADDEAALAFYDAVGFDRTGRLPDHYGDGDGAVDGLRLARSA